MPKKAIKRKKWYREHCRRQVKAGRGNRPNGEWQEFGSDRMAQMMRAGYRVG